MAANQEKVEEKAVKELRDKAKAGKSSSKIENELNSQDVAYKIKNNTGEQQAVYSDSKPCCTIMNPGLDLQNAGQY